MQFLDNSRRCGSLALLRIHEQSRLCRYQSAVGPVVKWREQPLEHQHVLRKADEQPVRLLCYRRCNCENQRGSLQPWVRLTNGLENLTKVMELDRTMSRRLKGENTLQLLHQRKRPPYQQQHAQTLSRNPWTKMRKPRLPNTISFRPCKAVNRNQSWKKKVHGQKFPK